MKKARFLCMLLALIMVFSLSAVSVYAKEKPIEIKLTTTNAAANPEVVEMIAAADII